jgi:hypothetical protein
MIEIDDTLKKTLLFYLLFSFFLYQMKPDCMFHGNDEFKQFGTGPDKTIYPFWLVTTVLGMVTYIYLHVNEDEFV